MDNFWIIGGGKFGSRAIKALSKADSSNYLTIVEKKKSVCKRLEGRKFDVVCMDGIQYLERNLTSARFPDWIVPAIPLHVAYEWIRAKISGSTVIERVTVPDDLVTAVPNPITAKASQLYISIADFRCPENCPEPDEICTYTGKARSMILHEFLNSLRYKNFKSVVIRSHQLAPGVGGFTPAALFDALNQVRNTPVPILLSTACSCHAVLNSFKIKSILSFGRQNPE